MASETVLTNGIDTEASDFEEQEDTDSDDLTADSELCGVLQKWTNYFHGWQERYFILKDGCMSYFKCEEEVRVGSRGSISLSKAVAKQNEYDELRFDIGVGDSIWHLRAKDKDERGRWLDCIESQKGARISRHGSLFSLASVNSITSSTSLKRNKLQSQLSDLRVLRDLAVNQVNKLQSYYDQIEDDDVRFGCSSPDGSFESSLEEPMRMKVSSITQASIGSSFRAEAMTFRTTSAEMLRAWDQAFEIVTAQEEKLRSRLEKEIDKRKKAEAELKKMMNERMTRGPATGGPDCVEGPNSHLTNDMWYDAVDAAIEKLDEASMKNEQQVSSVKTPITVATQQSTHRLSKQCDNYVTENLKYAFGSEQDLEDWELLHSEGEMRVYRKEVEIDGVVVDPLKATHEVEGISAQEMTQWFFDPSSKMEWEGHLLESSRVHEQLAPDTAVIHSVMKRVWPSAARDMVFLTHIRHVCAAESPKQNDTWIVCNYSLEDTDVKLPKGSIRATVRASMVCQTIVRNGRKPGDKLSRKDVSCKVWYTASVNPGGWAPAKVLRQIYKHEYPKFLKNFGHYVLKKIGDSPVAVATSVRENSESKPFQNGHV